jgi:hypothetical protein
LIETSITWACAISPLGSAMSNQSINLDCKSSPGLGPFGSVRSLWAVVGGPWIRKTEREIDMTSDPMSQTKTFSIHNSVTVWRRPCACWFLHEKERHGKLKKSIFVNSLSSSLSSLYLSILYILSAVVNYSGTPSIYSLDYQVICRRFFNRQ